MAKKEKKRMFSSLYIFPVLLTVICVSYFIRFVFYNIDTEMLSFGEMENVTNCNAVIMRSEWTSTLPSNIKLDYKAAEGEKVAFGRKLVEVVKSNNVDDNTALKIKELDDRIAEIKKENIDNNFFSEDMDKINKNIADLTAKIKAASKSGDFSSLNDAKKELDANLYKKSLIEGQGSFYGKNLEQLNNEKKALESLYNKNIDVVYAQHAGVVGYDLDGFEQVLNPANIDKFKVSDIKEIISMLDSKKRDKKDAVQNGVKVVDNYLWYLCIVLDESQTEGLKAGKKVVIRFKDAGNVEADANVVSISKPENKEVLVMLKIDEYVKDFYKMRLTNIDIVKDHYEGFKITSKAIVQKENKSGVYILRNGLVRFVPVQIIKSEEDMTFIKNIDPDKVESSSAVTLKVFDEVITTVNKVKENQVIIGDI